MLGHAKKNLAAAALTLWLGQLSLAASWAVIQDLTNEIAAEAAVRTDWKHVRYMCLVRESVSSSFWGWSRETSHSRKYFGTLRQDKEPRLLG